MAAISRGQENTSDLINWFIRVNGVLTDTYTLEYRIIDVTAGYPGTQIFPVAVGTWEDVTNAPGNFNVGSYYAYDNGAGNGWTPELAANVGTHCIEWRWRISASAPLQLGNEEFEVLVQSAGSSVDTYCSVQDIRDLGITVAMANDTKVLNNIRLAQAFIERACRQWFVPKILTLNFDGTDSDAIHMGIPIISIDYLKLNNSDDALSTDLYRAYTARTYPDDRRNPRIKLIGPTEYRDIFVAPVTWGIRLIFRKGRQNQIVKGTFGFIEEDGSTPELISHATCKLTVQKLSEPLFVAPGTVPSVPAPPPILGPLIEEVTDDHKRKYGQPGGPISKQPAGLTGFTNDQEILDIIKLYKAPIGIATPNNWTMRG